MLNDQDIESIETAVHDLKRAVEDCHNHQTDSASSVTSAAARLSAVMDLMRLRLNGEVTH